MAVLQAQHARDLARGEVLVAVGLAVGVDLQVVAAFAHQVQQQARVEAAGQGQHDAVRVRRQAFGHRLFVESQGLVREVLVAAVLDRFEVRMPVALDRHAPVLQHEPAGLGQVLGALEQGVVAVGALLRQEGGDRGAVHLQVDAAPGEANLHLGTEEEDLVVQVPVHVGEAELAVEQLQATVAAVVDHQVEVSADAVDEVVAVVEVEVQQAARQVGRRVGHVPAVDGQGRPLEQQAHIVAGREVGIPVEGGIGRHGADHAAAAPVGAAVVPVLVGDEVAHGVGDIARVAIGGEGCDAVDSWHVGGSFLGLAAFIVRHDSTAGRGRHGLLRLPRGRLPPSMDAVPTGGPTMPSQPSTDLQTFPNPQTERDYEIRFDCPEFTCLCPLTGQPDFAHLRIRYVPDALCVELKSLKLYLWIFRDRGAFHEAVTNEILEDLVRLLDPRFLEIDAKWFVRGGITTYVRGRHAKTGWTGEEPPAQDAW